mgnify:CR=1 FL=1
MASTDAAPRSRRTFARLDKVLDVPHLIDIQRRSFAWLTDAESGGLRETINDISPIEDYTGNLAVEFGEFVFDEPVAPIDECRECGDGGGWTWSVMRHLSLAPDEVALLADGVADAATLGALVSGASATEALAPRHGRAALGAVALPAITRGADDDRAVTARAGVEPIRGGNRRPPARSGWTRRHPDATLAAGSRSRLAATPTKARVARPGPSLLPETPPR